MISNTTQSPQDQEVVAWQARRTDGSPLARWEDCTHEAHDATVKTGRYLVCVSVKTATKRVRAAIESYAYHRNQPAAQIA